MAELRADFHTHSGDDPHDRIPYSSEQLIDAASDAGMDVLAITCHAHNVWTRELSAYAQDRNVLLIPGMEMFVGGKHAVILNPDPKRHHSHMSFDELRSVGRCDAAFIAAHPYYPTHRSLLWHLERQIDLFDAIEYSSLWTRGLNPNWWAERVARRHGLPLVGSSDTHVLPYYAGTFTWVDAKPTVEDVVAAIREGRVRLETRPRRFLEAINLGQRAVIGMMRELIADWAEEETRQ